jgi:peptidyl-prolyl cis-trans isomerase B (cyclophilin B)
MDKITRNIIIGFIAIAIIAGVIDMTGTTVTKTAIINTNMGTIVVELYPAKAPITVANFIQYANSGFYNGTIFHRVIPGFMIQGGGFTTNGTQKPTNPPIQNEANNGLQNLRGTIAMARTNDINSATSQFFINVADNDFLNYQNSANYGYAVFGKVTSGLDVVDSIVNTPTETNGDYSNWPINNVVINSIVIR